MKKEKKEIGIESKEAVWRRTCKNWNDVKKLYISGYYSKETEQIEYPTKTELTRALGLNEAEVSARAEKEKWDTFRALFKQKSQERQDKQQLMLLLSESARYEQQQLRNFEKITRIIENKLDRSVEGINVIDENGNRVEGEIVEEITAKDLQMLTNTLATCRDQIRNIIGEDKTLVQIAEEIENEKRLAKEGETADIKIKTLKEELEELAREKKQYDQARKTRNKLIEGVEE